MSSIVYLKNKTNGKTYAYLNESVWDKETGRCRCKRKCLGHLDPATGEIIPNKGKKDSALVSPSPQTDRRRAGSVKAARTCVSRSLPICSVRTRAYEPFSFLIPKR